MENLKKVINNFSKVIYKYLKKISNYISNDDNSLLIKSIIKLITLISIYFVCGLIAEGITQIGTYIIYQTASTARAILSSIWSTIVSFTYFLFIIFSLYQLINISKKEKNFFSLSKDKKIDKEKKTKVFLTATNIIKILGTVILIPLIITNVGLLFILGILIGYLKQGIYLISLFIGCVGLILFLTTLIILIKKLLSLVTINLKKYLYLLIISGLLVATSSISILLEISKYDINQNLTPAFDIDKIKYEYKIDNNKEYIIKNNNTDNNIELIIDEDLGSYLEITVKNASTSELTSLIKQEKNKVLISYDQDLNIQINDFQKIYDLGLTMIKEKTIYNYTLLKYAKIEVRTSSQYAKYIKFMDSKGKVYTPYERNNK